MPSFGGSVLDKIGRAIPGRDIALAAIDEPTGRPAYGRPRPT